MTCVGWEAHVAVYDAVAAALAGTATVHDGTAPEGTPHPYVTLPYSLSLPRDFLSTHRTGHFFVLTVWSTYAGSKEVQDIADAIRAALHHKRLPMAAGRMLDCKVYSETIRRDADGATRHGTITIELTTEP